MKKHLQFWPILLLITITISLGLLNYQTGTWLTGWDNLHPEFNFWINIKRSLFAVWQEYQGLGLLGGMGHATALPRELLLLVLSLFIPTELLRYTWHIAMLGLGAIGTYILLKQYILTKTFPHTPDWILQTTSFFASLFYLTNLATVQMFHVPFEAFSAHFGFLPWLIYGFLLVIENPTKKRMLFFIFLNIISATQAYVPTLFVVYGILLGIISLVHILTHRSLQALTHIFLAGILIVTTNAYWMLPFGYFTATRSQVNINAKINQMATEEVYLRNKAFGTLNDTIQLKGFWFDTFDFDPQKSQVTPLLSAWQQYSEKPISIVFAYTMFLFIIGGSIVLLFKKKYLLWWISIACLVSITMLTTDTIPFSTINTIIREQIPLINQAFRFPFTKWSIVNAWLYSLLFAISLTYIFLLINRNRQKKVWLGFIIIASSVLFLYQSVPLVSGQLFYRPMQQTIPTDYFSVFRYFQQKPLGRIANFPQTTFWGWTYYRWGYTGSGFPWYGIEHPILDRAFDPWSRENENYYWEVSYALYSKDPQKLQAVFQKYDIRYVMLDESTISPSHNRALFTDELKRILSEDPQITNTNQFGNITVYERETFSDTFIATTNSLPNVLPAYDWGDHDQAALDKGLYKSDPSKPADIYFPFRTLFSKRPLDEQPVTFQETNSDIILTNRLSEQLLPYSLTLPPEATETARLSTNDRSIRLILDKSKTLQYDSNTDPNKPIQATNAIPCATGKKGIANPIDQSDGKQSWLSLQTQDQRLCLSFGIPTLYHKSGYLVSVEHRHTSGRPLLFSVINQTAKHSELENFLPLDKDWTTSYFFIPPLANDGLGYTIYFYSDSIGRDKTINELKSVRVHEIPFQALQEIQIGNSSRIDKQPPLSVFHPNISYYLTKTPQNAEKIILYQSFHPGWKAYKVNSSFGKMLPFLFGKEIPNHILINNWANGWEISEGNSNTIVIFFLPQLLQWVGFGLLPVPFLLLLVKRSIYKGSRLTLL
jgi:hypothetical protein